MISVIICTYNRPALVSKLVTQILGLINKPQELIVVDSSNTENIELVSNSKVRYVRSLRKSQPYQRFLGAREAQNDIICYFDDDLRIIEEDLFVDIEEVFIDVNVVGVSAGIQYESGVAIHQISDSKKLKRTGEISWLGRTTGLPQDDVEVQYFPGPIMAFRKQVALKLFDEYLFTIFEKRIAMGEDKAISMRASQYGKLIYLGSKKYLHHPPEPSTYYTDEVNFIAKVVFSRLWLSKVYSQVRGKPMYQAYLMFGLYTVKSLVTALIKPKRLKGILTGLYWTFRMTSK